MTRKRLSLALLALLFCAGAAYTVTWIIEEMRYRALLADRALIAGERDISVKPERPCPDPDNALVFVIFGQSNAANHGAVRTRAPAAVFDFFDARCFSGDDPQFSATGKGGTPWPSFAQALRERGETRPILMANVAVGDTRADQWVEGAEHGVKLKTALKALSDKSYRVDAALFFQGEADHKTSEQAYLTSLRTIADGLGDIPFVLSNSSLCGANSKPAQRLTNARKSLAADQPGVFLGPNTDALGSQYRSDGCHFNEAGLQKLGTIWADSVQQALTP